MNVKSGVCTSCAFSVQSQMLIRIVFVTFQHCFTYLSSTPLAILSHSVCLPTCLFTLPLVLCLSSVPPGCLATLSTVCVVASPSSCLCALHTQQSASRPACLLPWLFVCLPVCVPCCPPACLPGLPSLCLTACLSSSLLSWLSLGIASEQWPLALSATMRQWPTQMG